MADQDAQSCLSRRRAEVLAAKARLLAATAPGESDLALTALTRRPGVVLAVAAVAAFVLIRKRGMAAAMAAGGFLARSQTVRRLAAQWLLSQALARRGRPADPSA